MEVQRTPQKSLAKIRGGVSASLHPWYKSWLIVVQCENTATGQGGFKDAPDAARIVEIGYEISSILRGRRCMTEAMEVLAGWTFPHPGYKRVTATSVLPDDGASHIVLIQVGSKETGMSTGFIDLWGRG